MPATRFMPQCFIKVDKKQVSQAFADAVAEVVVDTSLHLPSMFTILLHDAGVTWVDDALLDRLVEVGFDPVYGARPLKRAIQQQLENPLAQDILAGRFQAGDTIRGRLEGDKVVFA